jgi:actin-related protein
VQHVCGDCSGSGFIKAGFGGKETPWAVVPTCVPSGDPERRPVESGVMQNLSNPIHRWSCSKQVSKCPELKRPHNVDNECVLNSWHIYSI